jgi:hypothetical protein
VGKQFHPAQTIWYSREQLAIEALVGVSTYSISARSVSKEGLNSISYSYKKASSLE